MNKTTSEHFIKNTFFKKVDNIDNKEFNAKR